MSSKIDHLINGKHVAGRDYFDTVNPATQEVLAQVACGGAAEVNAAVAAAKDAFPAWAATPAPQRARIIRKLGDLIAAHVPDLARTETDDCGQPIAQTGRQLVPRGLGHRARRRHLELRGILRTEECRSRAGQSSHPQVGRVMPAFVIADLIRNPWIPGRARDDRSRE